MTEQTLARVERIRTHKKQNNLTVVKIVKMLEDNGYPLSESSVRRVFEGELIGKNFREDTIAAIEVLFFGVSALAKPPETVPADKAINFLLEQNAFLRESLKSKDEQLNHRTNSMQEQWKIIEWQREEIAELKAEIKELKLELRALRVRESKQDTVLRLD